MLSHGVTLSLRTWRKQLDALPAAGFEAIAYDHRGHGRSGMGDGGPAVDGQRFSLDQVAEGARQEQYGIGNVLRGQHPFAHHGFVLAGREHVVGVGDVSCGICFD